MGVAGTGGYPGAKAWAEDRFQQTFEASLGAWGYMGASHLCGCFCCARIFPAAAVKTCAGGHAVCPFCWIEAVLPDAAGFPIDRDFLLAMRQRWFGEVADELSGPVSLTNPVLSDAAL
jgi:hypothetical protein